MKAAAFFRSWLFKSLLIPLVIILCLQVLQLFPRFIERYYTNGIYRYWSVINAKLTGIINWSIGDVLYFVAIAGIIILVIRYIVYLIQGKHVAWYAGLFRFVRFVMYVYIVFQLSWGLNYYRAGSAYQLQLDPPAFEKNNLVRLADTLRNRLSTAALNMQTSDSAVWYDADALRIAGIEAYNKLSADHPFIHKTETNVKWSFFNRLGGYGGFTGYFNPFTGEAQVIRRIPPFQKPYVLCHELAHHQGFASEEEANLIGYMATVRHPMPAVRYSAWHDLYYYTLFQLQMIDSSAAKANAALAPPLVKLHRKQEVDYYVAHHNAFTGWLNALYNRFLKFNNQSKGLASYSYVTAWLIAYAEKYGWDKL